MSSVVHDKLYIYWKQNYRFAVPVISQYFFLMKQERMSVSIARRKKKDIYAKRVHPSLSKPGTGKLII